MNTLTSRSKKCSVDTKTEDDLPIKFYGNLKKLIILCEQRVKHLPNSMNDMVKVDSVDRLLKCCCKDALFSYCMPKFWESRKSITNQNIDSLDLGNYNDEIKKNKYSTLIFNFITIIKTVYNGLNENDKSGVWKIIKNCLKLVVKKYKYQSMRKKNKQMSAK